MTEGGVEKSQTLVELLEANELSDIVAFNNEIVMVGHSDSSNGPWGDSSDGQAIILKYGLHKEEIREPEEPNPPTGDIRLWQILTISMFALSGIIICKKKLKNEI